MKLDELLASKIPLIAVHTADVLNIKDVLVHSVSKGKKKKRFLHLPTNTALSKIPNIIGEFGYMVEPDEMDCNTLYKSLEANDQVLVLVNPEIGHDAVYDAGIIKTPITLIEERLVDLLEDVNTIKYFLPILKDLTLKQIEDVLKLSSHLYGEISEESLRAIKRKYGSLSIGISEVDTSLPFYYEIEPIEAWLATQGHVIHKHVPRELKPRGLLFSGLAGTGKTYSAKRIAAVLKIPLYRLDIGSLMGKYVGESERNLEKALAIIESANPCVVLVDEVEKIFNATDDSGVSGRLLSQLLWWLQEHKCNIITIMTTNNVSAIPKELYRAGRIDKQIRFSQLTKADADDFISKLAEKYKKYVDAELLSIVSGRVASMGGADDGRTYANLTEALIDVIRRNL